MHRNNNIAASNFQRRGQSFSNSSDRNNLDLFAKSRRAVSAASSDDSSDVSVKLGRLSVGSGKVTKTGLDDLLSSTDGGKHDYDWLLTPPGTPLFPSSDGSESLSELVAPRSSSMARSASTTKASRLSLSQSDSHHSSRPARSNSVTRSSVSSSQYGSYSTYRSSNILNTSSASVSSCTRPSSPMTRTRPSTPSSRPTLSRPSTPSRVHPTSSSSSVDKTGPSQNSRPSTPSSRPQISANLNSAASRPNSRPSTPTRRNSMPSLSTPSGPLSSNGRPVSNGRASAPSSRPSSPGPRIRSSQQPVVPSDSPLETPPNLRTTLPDRPLSAGRSRPGASVSKSNPETTVPASAPRRHSSPIVTMGRVADTSGRCRVHSNGHVADMSEPRKPTSESGSRRSVKSSSTSTDNNGLGRSISKKSLDMAIRHMDIRNGGSNRPLSGTTLFPQSIRSAASKVQSARSITALESMNNNGNIHNGVYPENGHHTIKHAEFGCEINNGRYSAKLSEVEMYESSRYDAILLKEDLKNTSWLHSIDDKSDQGSIFDNGFEPLPEPFGPL